MPIDYAFRPCLRIRLTLGGRTCPRNPWNFGGKDSHLTFRYSCPHNRFHTVHGKLLYRFNPVWNAPLPCTYMMYVIPVFGTVLTPDHFRRRASRLVSYYAMFKWWLPLSQHPSCPRGPTSFVT